MVESRILLPEQLLLTTEVCGSKSYSFTKTYCNMERDLISRELQVLDAEMDYESPIQPIRCTQVTTLYEQPTYEKFLKQVKKWIRTCVQEGREHTLLDNNFSLRAAWDYLQSLPVSMDLVHGRKIQVFPMYQWQRTTGYPYWRTTKITFKVIKPKGVAKLPDPIIIPDPVPVPDPKKDFPPKTEPGKDQYFFCTTGGIRSIQVKKGEKPSPPPEARSPLFPDYDTALVQCPVKIPDPIWTWKPPRNQTQPAKKGKDLGLGNFIKALAVFGAVIFLGRGTQFVRAALAIREIDALLRDLFPKQEIRYHVHKDARNRLTLLVEKAGKATEIVKFFDDLLNNGIITQKDYDAYQSFINDLLSQLTEMDAYRTQRFARAAGHWVRGYFIEDHYIERSLMKKGYVNLPNWFKGYDAYQQGAKFTISRAGGKYVMTFDNPGLVSIKSHVPKGGLKNLDLKAMKDRLLKEWMPKMNFADFEKENIRITNPKAKELHLILLGEEDKSEFIQQLRGLEKIFKDAKIKYKILQYKESVDEFLEL